MPPRRAAADRATTRSARASCDNFSLERHGHAPGRAGRPRRRRPGRADRRRRRDVARRDRDSPAAAASAPPHRRAGPAARGRRRPAPPPADLARRRRRDGRDRRAAADRGIAPGCGTAAAVGRRLLAVAVDRGLARCWPAAAVAVLRLPQRRAAGAIAAGYAAGRHCPAARRPRRTPRRLRRAPPRRRRPGPTPAAAAPAPAARCRRLCFRAARAQARSAVAGGIVATGLRPWIDVELAPDRALVDDEGAAIAFDVTLFNSGSAPARDVIVEARLLNAGARQDVELSDFLPRSPRAGRPDPGDRADGARCRCAARSGCRATAIQRI